MATLVLPSCVWLAISVPRVLANSTSTEESSVLENGGVKAAITCAVLVFLFIVSVIIAKIFDVILDRQSIDDGASDISDHTRDLIRARLSVIQFKRKEMSKTAGQKTLAFFRRWAEKAKRRGRQRRELIEANRPATAEKKPVIRVQQVATAVYPGTVPSFLRTTDNKRTSQTTLTATVPSPAPLSPSMSPGRATPVPPPSPKPTQNAEPQFGLVEESKSVNRPKSSRSRDSRAPVTVNVTSTEMPGTPRIPPRSVHFKDQVKRNTKASPLPARLAVAATQPRSSKSVDQK